MWSKLTRSRILEDGDEIRKFPHHGGRGKDEASQNHAMWGWRSHPSAPPLPFAIPRCNSKLYYMTKFFFYWMWIWKKNIVGLKFLLILHMLAKRSEISYYVMDHMFKFQVFVFKIMHKIWIPKWNRKWNLIDTKLGMYVKNIENM